MPKAIIADPSLWRERPPLVPPSPSPIPWREPRLQVTLANEPEEGVIEGALG